MSSQKERLYDKFKAALVDRLGRAFETDCEPDDDHPRRAVIYVNYIGEEGGEEADVTVKADIWQSREKEYSHVFEGTIEIGGVNCELTVCIPQIGG